jgi:hypothetical protein
VMTKRQAIPNVLYHGTSYSRYILIQRFGLRGDAPRTYEIHPKHPKNHDPRGYVYLTGNERSAEFYALKITEIEHRLTPEERARIGITQEEYYPVILTIDTKDLRTIEVDPEAVRGESWFRVKGNVLAKYITKIKTIVPLDRQQDSEFKDKIDFDIELSSAHAAYDPKKYAATLLTVKPQYPELKQFYLDWMKKYDNDFFGLVTAELQP